MQKMNSPLKLLLQKTLSTPTIRSGLDVMKKKLMIQQKTDSLICLACITAKMLQYLPTGEVSTIISHDYDDVLEKRFFRLLVISKLTFSKFWKLDVALTDSSRFSKKSENHYSLLLFTIHFHYSWYFSHQNFAYLKGDVPYFKSNFALET